MTIQQTPKPDPAVAQAAEGFDPHWETAVYAADRNLSLYPDSGVVSFALEHLGVEPDRSKVRVLEVGCGSGNNLWFLAREGFSVAGIDGSETAVAFAGKRLSAEGLQADLRRGDFQNLPWDDGVFDCVIDRGAITHNRRAVIAKTLDEVARVLRSGGRFLSMIYGDTHPGRSYGRPLDDGAYHGFSGGPFAELALTFFASKEDLDELYASRFRLERRDLELMVDHAKADPACDKAMWHLVCRKVGAAS